MFGLTVSSPPDILRGMEFPTLYKLTSTGKVQMWHIEANPVFDGSIVTTYGLLDGKKQTAVEEVKGKNIGKANETTPFEQAISEAKSQWEKKSKKGYVQNIEDAQEKKVDSTFIAGGIAPMLAHTFEKQGHKITYPAYVQPKLDGHRCIAIYQDGKATLWSRTQKRITGVPHIERAIETLLSVVDFDHPIVLDGELYNHDYKDKFEELTSFIRQVTPKPGHEVVQYWIYDMVTPAPFSQRLEMLEQLNMLLESGMPYETLTIVPTDTIENEEELTSAHNVFASEYGFEGAMVRNAMGRYKNGRSYDLQKVKTFEDAEFKVVAIEEGKGKMAGKAMFVCELENGETFRVKMVGALDDLAEYFDNPEPWLGKQLTVKFQGKSAYGVPRFPVALRFREDI